MHTMKPLLTNDGDCYVILFPHYQPHLNIQFNSILCTCTYMYSVYYTTLYITCTFLYIVLLMSLLIGVLINRCPHFRGHGVGLYINASIDTLKCLVLL